MLRFGNIVDLRAVVMVFQKKERSKTCRRSAHLPGDPRENRTSEAVTICWTVTLTTLFFCDLAAIAAPTIMWSSHPPAQRMAMLRELLLYSGVLVGLVSLGASCRGISLPPDAPASGTGRLSESASPQRRSWPCFCVRSIRCPPC